MTILLISDNDRSTFACSLLAEQLQIRGHDCLTVGPELDLKKESPLPFLRPQVNLSLDALLASNLIERASALGVFLKQPKKLKAFIESYRNLSAQIDRPAAPVFSGPLQASLGDRLMQNLYEHMECDLLLLPGELQYKAISDITRYWPAEEQPPILVKTGLWFMPERPRIGYLNGVQASPPRQLLALVQDNVPSVTGGKSQLLRQLIQWAEASHNWSVVVQMDYSRERGRSWIPNFKEKEWSLPSNLFFSAPGQLLNHLASCSACMSISSPWTMTAMAWGKKILLAGDYGIHTNEATTSWFGCGNMHRMQSIHNLDQVLQLPDTNQIWLESMGWGIHDGVDRLINALKELRP